MPFQIYPTSNQCLAVPSVALNQSSHLITRATDDNAISNSSYLYQDPGKLGESLDPRSGRFGRFLVPRPVLFAYQSWRIGQKNAPLPVQESGQGGIAG